MKGLKRGEDEHKAGTMFGAVLCTAKLKGKSDLLVGAPAYAGQHEYNSGAVYVYLSNSGVRCNVSNISIVELTIP